MQATLVDVMGSDLTVVNAARVSFSKKSDEFKDQDAKLINYLAKHNHWTPFGHATAQFHIKAPIFVARQLVKHQVGLVWNEVSRRYVDSIPEFWFPEEWRQRPEASIKQGSGKGFSTSMNDFLSTDVEQFVGSSIAMYTRLLEHGVAPEMARVILPQNMYTEWYWTGSLYAFARVCMLRCKPDAQQETREIADQIDAALIHKFPVSWEALRSW